MKFLLIWIVGLNVIMLYASTLEIKIDECKNNNSKSCFEAGMELSTGKNAQNQEKKTLGMEYIRKACKYGENQACDVMGEHYFRDKHYGSARPYLEDSCERNIVNACMALGTIYRDGHDVKQDDVSSRKYYEKACELGSKDSCINVAIIYRGGFGVEKNRDKEKSYYKKACKLGSQTGCKRFTTMQNKDDGIEEPTLLDKLKSLFN